jgi:hypothetical protein
MLARQAETESIAGSWLPLAAAQPADSAIAPELESLIAAFESQARDNSTAGAGAAVHSLGRADTQQLVLVSVISSPSPAAQPAPGPGSTLAGGTLAGGSQAASGTAPPPRFAQSASSVPPERLQAVTRPLRSPSRGASADPGASPTLPGSLPSGAGTAFGGGATGLAAPAAALLVVAAACLLAMRLLGRPVTDPLTWRSALLSLRLERPG